MEEEQTKIIMDALSTLKPPHLSDLSNTILQLTHRHHRRLSSLLSSPPLFSLTLHHLHSLSLPHKIQLIAQHLLFSLHHLTQHFPQNDTVVHRPPPRPPMIKHRDYDSVLLLLLLCEVHQQNPEALKTPIAKWRLILCKIYSNTMLTIAGGVGGGVYNGSVLLPFIEMVIRCMRFVNVGKEGMEVAAAPAVVVALPSVEVKSGVECAICKEEMRKGRDVCELPCRHLFHWMCILPWLKKRNTCPCCRFRLPTDDVFGELERLWRVVVKASGGGFDGGVCM